MARLGSALAAAGVAGEPLEWFSRSLETAPAADTWCRMASHLLTLGQAEDAQDCFQQALILKPGFLPAQVGLAAVLHRCGHSGAAFDLLQRLSGDVTPQHALLLGQVCRVLNRPQEGVRAVKKALQSSPGTEATTMLLHVLAHLLDQQGESALAFGAVQKANDMRRLKFDPDAWDGALEGIARVFSQEALAGAPTSENPSEKPVFIVGMPRSGTSLVEQILSCHSQFAGAGEADDLSRVMAEGDLDPVHLQRRAADILARLDTVDPAAQRVSNKLPQNFLHLGLLALLFPRARVIHCVRSPMDTALSCYFQNFQNDMPWATRQGWAARYLLAERRLMAHWKSVLPLGIHTVSYEQLVMHPEATIRSIVRFCGLSWEPACTEPHLNPRVVHTASSHQVRAPLHDRSVGRARKYAPYLGEMRALLEKVAG
jgi:tetratricopeptide (TPR) repeat protein